MVRIVQLSIVFGWMLLAAVYFIYLSFTNEQFFGGADEVAHYSISRYSWHYPERFLDLWGKPLFTTLSSPFAQFGFTGLRLFNVLCGLLTAWLGYRILLRMGMRFAWLAIPITFVSPVYFMLVPTALTEVLFGLVLMFGIYRVMADRYMAAALVLSFLPFARNEGFVVILALLPVFLMNRQFKAIPYLLTGYVSMTLLGWVVFGDWLWLIHQNPYHGTTLYGKGAILHFVRNTRNTVGIPLAVLASAAWCFMMFRLFKPRSDSFRCSLSMLLLTSLPFLAYLAAHSYVWWAGLGGSLGLMRVIGAVSPLVSLAAAWLLASVFTQIKSEALSTVIALTVAFLLVLQPIRQYDPPLEADEVLKTLTTACEWISKNKQPETKLYSYDPRVFFYLDIDPYDSKAAQELPPGKEQFPAEVKAGSWVVWDAHFGNNEGQTPRQKLLEDPNFRLIKSFAPKDTVRVLNGFPYEVMVLERTADF